MHWGQIIPPNPNSPQQIHNWKIPIQMNAFDRPLTIRFYEANNNLPQYEYTGSDRTAKMVWPSGLGGYPVSVGFAVGIHYAAIQEFRRDQGLLFKPLTQAEQDIIDRGKIIGIRLRTNHPYLYSK